MGKYSWLKIAEGEIGQREKAGNMENQRIVEYHATTTLRATKDEIPWCSSFVNWVMLKSGYNITRSAAAKSWAKYGVECKPHVGCIVVMTRPGGNHVGFYIGKKNKRVLLLGGNQSNSVNVTSFPENVVIGYRIPAKLNENDSKIFTSLNKPTVASNGITDSNGN